MLGAPPPLADDFTGSFSASKKRSCVEEQPSAKKTPGDSGLRLVHCRRLHGSAGAHTPGISNGCSVHVDHELAAVIGVTDQLLFLGADDEIEKLEGDVPD